MENCSNLGIVENGRMKFYIPNVNEPSKEEAKITSPIANETASISHVKPKSPDYVDFPIDLGTKEAHFVYPKHITQDELQIIKIMLEAKLKTLITISNIQNIDKEKISFNTEIMDSDSIKKEPQ